MSTNKIPSVLVFSAIDGCGGAGTLMDYRVLSHAQCIPLTVITAITAQNLDGVQKIWPLTSSQIVEQFKALQSPIQAIKIGVVGKAINSIAKCLDTAPHIPVVFDPVLKPSLGMGFTDQKILLHIQKQLIKRSHIITPNRQELLTLSNEKKINLAIRALLKQGANYILATDVNGRGKQIQHLLFGPSAQTPLWETKCERKTGHYHGSGCFFSSALTAHLAHGKNIVESAQFAHQQTLAAIDTAIQIPALGKQFLL